MVAHKRAGTGACPYATARKEVQEKLLPGSDRGVPCFISLGEVKNTAPSRGGVGAGGLIRMSSSGLTGCSRTGDVDARYCVPT